MDFFDQKDNVEQYLKMTEAYLSQGYVDRLKEWFKPGSRLLELGMGPGKDLELMSRTFDVTGSDRSQIFIDLYKEKFPSSKLCLLDAVGLETDQVFDGIYTNKVLMHLSEEDLRRSLKRQSQILVDKGMVCHSFWYGNGEEDFSGLHFTYYNEERLKEIFGHAFQVIEISLYTEEERDDSLFVVARKQ